MRSFDFLMRDAPAVQVAAAAPPIAVKPGSGKGLIVGGNSIQFSQPRRVVRAIFQRSLFKFNVL